MGTIAARDCLRVLELTEQVVVATLLATCQGVQLRRQQKQDMRKPAAALEQMLSDITSEFELLTEDRPLEHELRYWLKKIRQQPWALYEE